MRIILIFFVSLIGLGSLTAQDKHIFSLGKSDFLLDGKPFQIISGEMHPARIPREYWQHRIRMAKAMGCNTIAAYIFWNYLESSPGVWDFSTGNRDVAAFIRLCKQEGMWVLLRPGPYVCAEWDWGGLPPYLLKIPDIKVRCMDPRYISAVRRYVTRLSKEVAPLQCDRGGPILMVQVENEYGSYGNDRTYVETMRKLWVEQGITVPFYTADGAAASMLDAGSLDGCAIGLDSGSGDADFEQARKRNPNVPAFSSESYPGWLTHWKEHWQKPDTAGILREVSYLLSHKRSFNLYVVHGGTNFGFTAGANAFSPVQFQPDVTSYDYDAPINEQGQATPKYYALRRLIGQQVNYKIPEPPAPIPAMEIPPVDLQPFTSIWDHLPPAKRSPQPRPMEYFDQSAGLILYRTRLIGHKSGSLTITEPHDYALVFLNGHLIDTVFRDGGKWTVQLPKTDVKDPVLEILVEGMGHINFAQYMIDRKGITDRVTLNGMTLMDWDIFCLPLDEKYMRGVRNGGSAKGTAGTSGQGSSLADAYSPMRRSSGGRGPAAIKSPSEERRLAAMNDSPGEMGKATVNDSLRKRDPAAVNGEKESRGNGVFFKGSFELDGTADTYIDMSQFKKGVVWVNGHNLGRYWYVGPQQHLYCPASWLKKGKNELIVFDLHQQAAASVKGVKTLE